MLLLQAGFLLCCGALCFTFPLLSTRGTGCALRSLIQETLIDVQTLNLKGSSEIKALNDTMEAGGNVITYLKGFIEALKRSKEMEERLIAQKLQKIQHDGELCLGRMEQEWEPVEEEDFFSNLEYFLRFLNHYYMEETT